MTEQDMPARRRRRPASNQSPPPRWPGDIGVGGARTPFPPLRRTSQPLAPEAAAERWLARFRDLAGASPGGNVHAASDSADAPAAAAAEASQ